MFFQIQSSKREEERRERDVFLFGYHFIQFLIHSFLLLFFFLVLDNFFTEFEQYLMCMLIGLVCLTIIMDKIICGSGSAMFFSFSILSLDVLVVSHVVPLNC